MNVIDQLYALEINAAISWFWDGGFDVDLGDEQNGIRAHTNVDTWAEVEDWLREKAAEHWPGCAAELKGD